MSMKSFDLSAPGAVDDLLAFHRGLYGDAVMMADESPDEGGDRDSEDRSGDSRDGKMGSGDSADDGRLSEGGKRALEAERRDRKAAERAAREAAARAKELEDRVAEFEREKMSVEERLAAERDELRKKYDSAAATAAEKDAAILKYEVAAEKGLTLAQARRLVGTTREDLEADADAFLAEIPNAVSSSPFPPNTPAPDPHQGFVGKSVGRASTVAEAMAEYKARRDKSRATS